MVGIGDSVAAENEKLANEAKDAAAEEAAFKESWDYDKHPHLHDALLKEENHALNTN